MAKRTVFVEKNECVACGECLKHCRKNAIGIIRGVYAVIDDTLCVGCAVCAKKCPAGAIKTIKIGEAG